MQTRPLGSLQHQLCPADGPWVLLPDAVPSSDNPAEAISCALKSLGLHRLTILGSQT